jgi:DNA modification methylase
MKIEHATQKPVAIMAKPIERHTRHGQGVYDPFLGSGATLIAAEQLGRRCFGMEIEPRYCELAVQRWEQFTGQTARRFRVPTPRQK